MAKTIWFLTGNRGKVDEAKHHFADLGYHVEQLQVKEGLILEPQAEHLADVARAKIEQARQYTPSSDALVMVEDAGLFIDALHGFPGVYSANVMKTIGCDGVLRLLSHLEDGEEGVRKQQRSASFQAVAALWDGQRIIFGHGRCPGYIHTVTLGSQGFGFDPIFIPYDVGEIGEALNANQNGNTSSGGKTFGQLSMSEKNQFSHRRRALDDLIQQLQH